MAVVIETTIGDFTVDLFVESRPQACKNFLKLCKMKYYNFCLFHSVQPNFLAQTGDPTGSGSGGESIYGLLFGENVRYFEAEMMPKLKHNKPGLLSMVNCGNNMLGSQFFITLGEDLVSLDGTHCVFGEITEGVDVVLKLNEAICDTLHRPYKDIRITHTIILEDPFEDPSGLVAPDMSPEATQERLANGRIAADEEIDETAGMTAAQVEEMKQQREASARATILEIVGDLPDAEMAPPENVLFVCKLNPVTTDDDLEIIFSRFGKVKSCEVIRDKTTGDSLQYAFVEFEDQKSCEEAYFKMDNVLIDDRRIHVDFSQSVAKMQWRGKGRGVIYHDNKDQSKDVRSSSHRDREDSKSRTRRDRDYDEKERRRDRGRDREDDRQGRERGRDRDAEDRERGKDRDTEDKERGKDRDVEDRHRKRDERDRSRSDWRKRDSKHRKDDYRDDEKRYDSKRKDYESSRRKEDDSKRVSSSTSNSRKIDDRKAEERRSDDKRSDDRKRDKESRDVSSRNSSRLAELEKSVAIEKNIRASIEKNDMKDKDRGSKFNSPVPNISREDNSSDKLINDSRETANVSGDIEISPETTMSNEVSSLDARMNHADKNANKEEKRPGDEEISKEVENGDTGDEKFSQYSDKRIDDLKKSDNKKKTLKRKRKVSESRKRKKRRHSSSSESSSESSDSSDSSSSSDSSDHRHGKKKKLIVAKRYYRGGKLVKEIKKKKRAKDTTDSGSVSEESSDTDSKRKHKSKKHKKVINIVKHSKRRNAESSDDSQSGSSSSDDSDFKDKKKKRKVTEKRLKKKYKNSTAKKKRQRKEETSSSSDSEGSVQHSISSKSSKKLKKSKSLKHNTSLLETNSSK